MNTEDYSQIEKFYAYVFINEQGIGAIAGVQLSNGAGTPLISQNKEYMLGLKNLVQSLADHSKKNIHLLEYSKGTEVLKLTPNEIPERPAILRGVNPNDKLN